MMAGSFQIEKGNVVITLTADGSLEFEFKGLTWIFAPDNFKLGGHGGSDLGGGAMPFVIHSLACHHCCCGVKTADWHYYRDL